jgi:hypothetical protein
VDRVEVGILDAAPPTLRKLDAPDEWQVVSLPIDEEYEAAVAGSGNDWELVVSAISPEAPT